MNEAAPASRPISLSWRALLPDLGVVAALIAVDVLLFWPVFFLGEFVPRGGGDLVSFLYPRYAMAARYVHHGTLPLWDPFLYSGQPYLADVQSGILYLPNLLAFFLSRSFDYHRLELLAIAHYALAGIFAYVYGRQLRLGRFGALTAGIVWEASGFLVAHLGHYNLIAAAVWLPLILALLQPALEGGSLAWVAAASLALGTSTLAGHTQLTIEIGLFLILYVLGYALANKAWFAPLRSLAVLGVWSVILCLVQLWPAYELTQQSVRADLSYSDATAFSLLPEKLILFLIPHFYGRTPDAYWGPPSLTENYLYVGILPLALAGLALLWTRDWRARTLGALAALGLFLAFADWTPLHGWLYALAPGFDKVRAPGRFILYVDFGLAMLAGIGADVLSRPLPRRRRPAFRLYLTGWTIFSFGMVAIAGPLVYLKLFVNQAQAQGLVQQIQTATDSFALTLLFVLATLALLVAYRYRWLRGKLIPAVALAVIVVDLLGNNAVINPTPNDPTVGFQHPAIVNYLNQHLGSARLDTVTGIDSIWQPDAAALYGYHSLWGLYDPFTLSDYYWLWKTYVPGRDSRLYDLLGAKYLLGKKDITLPKGKFQLVFTGDKDLNVYENPTAMPRAFYVSGSLAVSSHDAALAAIRDPKFDPARTVVVEDSAKPTTAPGATMVPGQFVVDGPNTVSVQINAPSNGYLVLTDPYYGGWEALVDGHSTTLYRADWAFRAVAVGPGNHVVTFRFRPRSLIALGVLSGLGWLAAVAYIGWQFLPRRRSAKSSRRSLASTPA